MKCHVSGMHNANERFVYQWGWPRDARSATWSWSELDGSRAADHAFILRFEMTRVKANRHSHTQRLKSMLTDHPNNIAGPRVARA